MVARAVDIIDKWADFIEYAHDKVGFYEILGAARAVFIHLLRH